MAPLIVLFALSLILKWPIWLAVISLILTLYVAYFFRNPYRRIPSDEDAVVSPADGKVVQVGRDDAGRWVISVFLNIFNVHVNRSPIAGQISEIKYIKGKFLAAYDPKASIENERNGLSIVRGSQTVEVIQIAGLIARRIVCWKKAGDELARGERFGLIRFGSRVDIILPAEAEMAVVVGQKIRGGCDMLARLKPDPQEP